MHKLLRKYKYPFLYKDTNSYFHFFKSEKIDLLFMACIAFFVPMVLGIVFGKYCKICIAVFSNYFIYNI